MRSELDFHHKMVGNSNKLVKNWEANLQRNEKEILVLKLWCSFNFRKWMQIGNGCNSFTGSFCPNLAALGTLVSLRQRQSYTRAIHWFLPTVQIVHALLARLVHHNFCCCCQIIFDTDSIMNYGKFNCLPWPFPWYKDALSANSKWF